LPNLPTHIDLAQQVARRIGHDTLEANLGYFLLGSTSPDIRVITRRKREEYHFATLDFKEVGAGVRGLFRAHPDLISPNGHGEPTQAFIAGYITHLIADETWITSMFRPYFGNYQVFEDAALGHVMDRALQLEMDRQCWEAVSSAKALLEAPAEHVDIEFIPPETLTEWGQWIVAFMERGFSWDRLRFMARRIAAGDEAHPAHHIAEEFVQNMPYSLERLHQRVPRKMFEEYREITLESLVKAVEDYLECE
jgi:hypothetical protein